MDGVELLIEPCQLVSVGTGMFAGTRGGKPGGRGGKPGGRGRWSDRRVDTERIVVSVLTGRIVVFVSTERIS